MWGEDLLGLVAGGLALGDWCFGGLPLGTCFGLNDRGMAWHGIASK